MAPLNGVGVFSQIGGHWATKRRLGGGRIDGVCSSKVNTSLALRRLATFRPDLRTRSPASEARYRSVRLD